MSSADMGATLFLSNRYLRHAVLSPTTGTASLLHENGATRSILHPPDKTSSKRSNQQAVLSSSYEQMM